MSVRNLSFLFHPKSVAVIGASEKPHSVGATVLRNLMSGAPACCGCFPPKTCSMRLKRFMAFFKALDPEDVRYRIFTRLRDLQPSQLARLTQIDYDREMAFIATRLGFAIGPTPDDGTVQMRLRLQ